MRKKIPFYPTGHAFFGKAVPDSGYIGEVDAEFDSVTITLIKPNTDTEDVIRSLEITIQTLKLQITREKKARNNISNNNTNSAQVKDSYIRDS